MSMTQNFVVFWIIWKRKNISTFYSFTEIVGFRIQVCFCPLFQNSQKFLLHIFINITDISKDNCRIKKIHDISITFIVVISRRVIRKWVRSLNNTSEHYFYLIKILLPHKSYFWDFSFK